jgi:hypothetical protein
MVENNSPFFTVIKMRCSPVVFDTLAREAIFKHECEAVQFNLAWPTWGAYYLDGQKRVPVESFAVRVFCVPGDEAAGIIAGEVQQVHLPYLYPYLFEGWTAVYATKRVAGDFPTGAVVALVRLDAHYPDEVAVGKRPLVGEVMEVRPLPRPEPVQPKGFTWTWLLPEHLYEWATEVCGD